MDIFLLLGLHNNIISRLFWPWSKYPYTITTNQNTPTYKIDPNIEQSLQIVTRILFDTTGIKIITTVTKIIFHFIVLTT